MSDIISRVTINGPPPPTDGVSVMDTLRPRFSRALLIVFAVRCDSRFENVRSVALYGSQRLNVAPDRLCITPAKGRRPEFLLYRRMMTDSADIDAFINDARSGIAT